MSRATETQLDVLHGALCEAWAARLQRAKDNPEESALTAAEATALAKFLKDNDITALPESTRMSNFTEELDGLMDYDGVAELHKYRTG